MRPINIDFGWQPHRTGRNIGILLLSITTAGAAFQVWNFLELRTTAESWQTDLHRIDHSVSATYDMQAPENYERQLAELRFANHVIDEINMPWDALFNAVEKTAGEEAVLLSVEPDAERRVVRLTGEAKDSTAMLEYLRELRRTPAIRDAHLTGHQINVQDPQRPVRFTIEAVWADASGPEKMLQTAPMETAR